MKTTLTVFVVICVTLALTAGAANGFEVLFGTSWDGVSLQEVLDAEYGVGAIDAATDYIGFLPGDPQPPCWRDLGVDGVLVREIAGYERKNIFGWYLEGFAGVPMIDGVDDGEIFSGAIGEGEVGHVDFHSGVQNFGFYLNPNGTEDAMNAPEPEVFFSNRVYNDPGPDGVSVLHAPDDGDPQCLVYDITHLRNGVPTFVLAWEDVDYGGEIAPAFDPLCTDADFQDLVIEVSASPLPNLESSWGYVKALYAE